MIPRPPSSPPAPRGGFLLVPVGGPASPPGGRPLHSDDRRQPAPVALGAPSPRVREEPSARIGRRISPVDTDPIKPHPNRLIDRFWDTRFVAKIPEQAGVFAPSTAGGRELGLASRPPAPFNSLSSTQPRSGHELTAVPKGPRDRQRASSRRSQIKLATRRTTMF